MDTDKLNIPTYMIRIDGQSVTVENANVNIFDHGFLYGDSVFEVVRTVDNKILFAKEHLQRLARSAEKISFELPWHEDRLMAEMNEIVKAKKWDGETYIRLIITRGAGLIDLSPESCTGSKVIMIGKSLPVFPSRFYETGIVLCLTDIRRNSHRAMDPGIKSGNYLNNVMAMIESKRKGADDAVMLNEHGNITESTTSNFYIVKSGRILTPPLDSGILAGITREYLRSLCESAKIDFIETVLNLEDLASADEMFLSGTVKGVMPVSRIVGVAEWSGKPGPVTKKLRDLYESSIKKVALAANI